MAAAEYPLIFAACRDLRHAWMLRSWRNGRREVICPTCGTVRSEALNERTGWKPTEKKYHYPKGYIVRGGGEHVRVEQAIDARRRLVKLAESQHIRWVGKEIQRTLRTA